MVTTLQGKSRGRVGGRASVVNERLWVQQVSARVNGEVKKSQVRFAHTHVRATAAAAAAGDSAAESGAHTRAAWGVGVARANISHTHTRLRRLLNPSEHASTDDDKSCPPIFSLLYTSFVFLLSLFHPNIILI